MLSIACKLLMIFCKKYLEIKRFYAFLVLFLALDVVYDYVFVLLLGVNSRVQAPEYLADLTVETVSWNLLACLHVLFSYFEVLLPKLWEAVKNLKNRVHVASVANVVDSCQPSPVKVLFLLVPLHQLAQGEVQVDV